MDFVIIGNSWDAGRDNPTSKHQIALALSRKGHRVLWVDGAGMRRPSLGSGGDRAKMILKLGRGMKPAHQVAENIWRISPLILPLPGSGLCRGINERIYLGAIQRAVRRIGLADPVLINFLPTIPGVEGRWRRWRHRLQTADCRPQTQGGEGRGHREWDRGLKTEDGRQKTEDFRGRGRRPEGGFKDEGGAARSAIGQPCVGSEAANLRPEGGGGEWGRDEGGDLRPEGGGGEWGKDEGGNLGDSGVVSGFKFQVSGFGTALVRCVYYCVDRWDQFGAYDGGVMERLDAECCRNADLVIASAQDLYERCKRHNENTVLMPHGVDWGHFRPGRPDERDEGGDLRPEGGVGGMGKDEGGNLRPEGGGGEWGKDEGGNLRPEGGGGEWGKDEGGNLRPEGGGGEWGKDETGNLRPEGGGGEWGKDEGGNLRPEGGDRGRGTGDGRILRDPGVISGFRFQVSAFSGTHRIGFFGLIDERMDVDLMIALAGQIEDGEVVLAGKADVNAGRLTGVQNIRMIGSVPYSDLPGLIATLDVCIIPYKVNELTKAINPIKLREMLAAGCPVVSTALPEVEKLAKSLPDGAVRVAGSRDEFIECVKRILDAPPTLEDRMRISDSVKDQDWDSKVEQLLTLINRRRSERKRI